MTEPIYEIVKSSFDAAFKSGEVAGRSSMKLAILNLMETSGLNGPTWANLVKQVCDLPVTEAKETK